MVLRSWATGIFGGPLTWSDPSNGPTGVAPTLAVWWSPALLACLVLLVRELARSRTTSLRGLWLPAYFLVCNVLLVAAGRASLIGPASGSSSATSASCRWRPRWGWPSPRCRSGAPSNRSRSSDRARCSTTRGGLTVRVRRGRRSGADVVGALRRRAGTQGRQPSAELARQPGRATPRRCPTGPSWSTHPHRSTSPGRSRGPANLVSHLVRPLRSDLRFSELVGSTAAGRRRAPAGSGRARRSSHLRAAAVVQGHVVRLPGRRTESVRVPLDGPVVFPALWVHVGYLASADSAVRVSAGGASYKTSVAQGFHDLYFRAGMKPFKAVRIGGPRRERPLCTNDVVVGQIVTEQRP